MRYLIQETDSGALFDAPAGEAGAEGAAPAGGADSPEPSPAVEPAAPAWQDTQEFQDAVWEATQAQFNQWQQQQEPQEGQPRGFDPDTFDPTDPEQFLGVLTERDKYMLQQMQELVAPLRQQVEHAQQLEGEARVKDVLADVQVRTGIELPAEAQQVVEQLAQQDFAEAVARNPALSTNDRVAEATIERRVREFGNVLNTYAEQYHQRKLNELQAATGARRETSSGAEGVEVPGEYKTEREAMMAWANRQNLTQV